DLPGNVRTISTDTASPGLAGFFGSKTDYPLFFADPRTDPNYAANKAMLGGAIGGLGGLTPVSMQGANINTAPQAQFRNQQLGLAQLLQAGAVGQGPS